LYPGRLPRIYVRSEKYVFGNEKNVAVKAKSFLELNRKIFLEKDLKSVFVYKLL
jgi:hypothetical protein